MRLSDWVPMPARAADRTRTLPPMSAAWSGRPIASRYRGRAAASEIRSAETVVLLPRLDEVAEPGELPFKAEFDRSDRPVALLADDDLCLAVEPFHTFLPTGDLFELFVGRLLALGM